MTNPDGEPWTLDTFAAGVDTDAVWSVVHPSELSPDQRFDAEYYKPEYLRLDTLLTGLAVRTLSELDGEFVVGPFGSSFTVDNYVDASPYRYIRGRDVKPFFLLADENVYVAKTDFNRLIKHSLRAGDLLISVVGTLGNVAVVDEDLGEAIFSCKSTVYRPRSFNPYYLCTYLNSEVGQDYLKRRPRGTIQTGLNLNDLKSIPIYVPDEEEQAAIGELVKRSRDLLRRADRLYADAEGCLLAGLGLSDLDLSYQPTYTRNFAHAWAVGRLDAEYFQPKHTEADRAIEQLGPEALGDLAKLTKGTEVGSHAYTDEGVLFVRVSTLTKYGIERRDSDKYISSELYRELQAGFRPRIGEILLSKDGTPGIAYCVSAETECIICSGIVRLEPLGEIDPEYIALIINSLVGQLQIQREATGTLIAHWRLDKIRRLKLPLLCQDLQVQIGDLVRSSKESSNEAKRLLGEAKRRVEQMILAGQNP